MDALNAEDQKWYDEEYAPRYRECWAERQPGQPILDFMDEQRVMLIDGMTSDKREIVIEENCDRAFALTFNKARLAELISELQAIHEEMLPIPLD